MRNPRRVVTGHDANGRARVASDGEVESIEFASGTIMTKLWGGEGPPHYPDAGTEPAYHDFFPNNGGFRFVHFSVPPDTQREAAAVDVQDDIAFTEKHLPGIIDTFRGDKPGMHRSETIDMIYVVSGACRLELDDAESVLVRAGDTIIQSGTMHRWRNPYDEICHLVGFLTGADWSGQD
ncbi:MAG: cupin domain-containing protein [Pseudomonadota bacterium]